MTAPVYYNRPLDQDFKQFLADANAIINELKSDGYRISEACRFCVFVKEFSKFLENGFGLGGQPFDIALLVQGMRDASELKAIAKSGKVRNEYRREIQEILGGAGKPSDDLLTQSRDYQFQLYLAAIFDLSGFVVENLEPDFTFKYEDSTYSVAAKRISSELKLNARFSEAKKQIKKSGINGFIAFSLDRIVWEKIKTDSYIVTNNPDTLYDAGKTILHDLLKTKVGKAALTNRDPIVIGHIASLMIPAILPRLVSLGFSSTLLFIPSIDVSEESTVYRHIRELPGKMDWPKKGPGRGLEI